MDVRVGGGRGACAVRATLVQAHWQAGCGFGDVNATLLFLSFHDSCRDLVVCTNTTGVTWLENQGGSFTVPSLREHAIDAHTFYVGDVAAGTLSCTTRSVGPQLIVGSPTSVEEEWVRVYTPIPVSASCGSTAIGGCGYTMDVVYSHRYVQEYGCQ